MKIIPFLWELIRLVYWEQRKLGESFNVMMGQSPRGENYTDNPDDYILVQGNADLKNGSISPRVWTTQVTKTASKGDIILSVRAPVGDVAKTQFDVVLGRGVAGIKGNDFLLHLLNKMKLTKSWTKFSTGSTFESINSSDLKDAIINVPNKAEQSIIGKFLKQLDDTIVLHQRKLDALKRLKEAYLQNILPEKEQSKPKLRFANFSEDWEQRKLGEVANIVGGGTPNTTNPDFWGGSIDWYSPVEIGEDIYVSSSKKKITKLGLQKSSAKLLPVGTVLFTSRAGIGNTAILAKEGTTNQGFQSIVPIEGLLDSYFIYSRAKELKKYGETNGAGSTFIEVSGKQMAKMNILIPSLDEQKKIAKRFERIDKLISLHQLKLDQLQHLKNAYLQKMFV